MIILALDLSTKSSGWAVYDGTSLVDCGCAAAASTNVYNRIDKITNEIEEVVKKYKPDAVIAEEPEPAFVRNNIDVYRKLTFVHGNICMMLNRYKLEMELCTSSHWRKLVGIKTGRGITRASLKPIDIAKAKEMFPTAAVLNDDIADAILIGYGYAQQKDNEMNWE